MKKEEFVFCSQRNDQKKTTVQQQYPDEPWLWKKEWREGVIHSRSKMTVIFSSLLALFWNAISTFLMFKIFDAAEKGNTAALLGLVFSIIGILLIIVSIYLFLRWRKFGDPTFHMASVPGVLGGRLRGTLRIPTLLRPEKEMVITLDCVHIETDYNGKNRETTQTILWQTEELFPRDMLLQENHSTCVPVDFYIPYDQPALDDSQEDSQIIWQLRAEAALPGVDFSASFNIPVFRTPESDSNIDTEVLDQGRLIGVLDEEGYKIPCYEPVNETETGKELRRAGLKMKPTPSGGIAIISPILRQPMLAVGMVFFILMWIGIILMVTFCIGASFLFLVPFYLFLLLLIWGSLDALTGIQWVEISKTGIRAKGGPFGRGVLHHLPFDAFAGFYKSSNMQFGNTKYFTVILQKKDDDRIKIFKNLKHSEAQAVIDALNTAINDYK